jgi:hypothetical protein
MAEPGNKTCAQPICRHCRKEHMDGGLNSDDYHCTLCTCSAYVSGPRMAGRRLLWAFSRQRPNYGGGDIPYTGG